MEICQRHRAKSQKMCTLPKAMGSFDGTSFEVEAGQYYDDGSGKYEFRWQNFNESG